MSPVRQGSPEGTHNFSRSIAGDRLAMSHCCSSSGHPFFPLPPASQLLVLRNRLETQPQLRKAAAISWKENPSLERGCEPEGSCGHQHLLLWAGLILPREVTAATQPSEGDFKK